MSYKGKGFFKMETIKVEKIAGLFTEVLPDPGTSAAEADYFNSFTAGLKACSTPCKGYKTAWRELPDAAY